MSPARSADTRLLSVATLRREGAVAKEVFMHAELHDASGDGVISSYPFALVP